MSHNLPGDSTALWAEKRIYHPLHSTVCRVMVFWGLLRFSNTPSTGRI